MDYTNEQTQGSSGIGGELAENMTLFGAIEELMETSWRVKVLVMGEEKQAEAENKPVPRNKITWARNMVMDTNKRLREVVDSLEIIGK